jgi:hypothetical protein
MITRVPYPNCRSSVIGLAIAGNPALFEGADDLREDMILLTLVQEWPRPPYTRAAGV